VTIKGSTAVTEELARAYPEETVVAQLKQLYKTELERALEEADKLLPHYRSVVDARTYACDHAKLRLAAAYSQDDSLSVRALERSLKYVLKQQRVFAGTVD
jgi:hypothetical protein